MFNSGLRNSSGYHLFRPQTGLQNYLLSKSLDVIFPDINPVNLIGQSHILLVWPKDPITELFSLLSITQFFIFPEATAVKKYSNSVYKIVLYTTCTSEDRLMGPFCPFSISFGADLCRNHPSLYLPKNLKPK
jgi:hypothetical protein